MHSLENAAAARTAFGEQVDVWTPTTDDPVRKSGRCSGWGTSRQDARVSSASSSVKSGPDLPLPGPDTTPGLNERRVRWCLRRIRDPRQQREPEQAEIHQQLQSEPKKETTGFHRMKVFTKGATSKQRRPSKTQTRRKRNILPREPSHQITRQEPREG